jgi:presenilin-like A22 family membrane protease
MSVPYELKIWLGTSLACLIVVVPPVTVIELSTAFLGSGVMAVSGIFFQNFLWFVARFDDY